MVADGIARPERRGNGLPCRLIVCRIGSAPHGDTRHGQQAASGFLPVHRGYRVQDERRHRPHQPLHEPQHAGDLQGSGTVRPAQRACADPRHGFARKRLRGLNEGHDLSPGGVADHAQGAGVLRVLRAAVELAVGQPGAAARQQRRPAQQHLDEVLRGAQRGPGLEPAAAHDEPRLFRIRVPRLRRQLPALVSSSRCAPAPADPSYTLWPV